MNNTSPCLKLNTILLIRLLIFITSAFLLSFATKNVIYAGCAANECDGPGEYECENGTMCCTGGGCPSNRCPANCTARIYSGYWTCNCTLSREVCSIPTPYDCEPCITERVCGPETTCGYVSSSTCAQWATRSYPCRQKTCWYNYCWYTWGTCKSTYCARYYQVWRCSTTDVCKNVKNCSTCYKKNCFIEYYEDQTTYTARGTCKYCTQGGGGGGGSCTTNPTAPTLNTPFEGSSMQGSLAIDFSWNAPTSWGANCTPASYFLMVDDESSFTDPRVHSVSYPTSTTSQTVTMPGEDTYFWRVQACNQRGCTSSVTRSFNFSCGIAPGRATNPSPSDGATDVTIAPTLSWDGPSDWGSACGMNNNNRFTVYGQVKNGVCEGPGSGYSAIPSCTNLPEGTTSCIDPFFNTSSTPYCWYVSTNNGTETTLSASTADEVWEFRTEEPITYTNWVTALFGDFYAGGLTEQYPSTTRYVTPWNPPYAAYEKEPTSSDEPNVALITSNDTDITNDNGANEYNPGSQSNLSVEFANFEETWPASYRGTPPASAINLPLNGGSCSDIFTGSTKLDPYEVYEADASCMSEAINAVDGNPNGYSLASDGYTVIFVTGSTNLEIDSPFTTSNDDYRVVFVTGPNVSVQIDRNLKLATDPDFNSEPLIEAAFIVTKDLTIEGAANDSSIDLTTDPDGSIMVEGPLIARTVNFNRNRGLTNQYPSEIVKYNPNYIYNLTEQERTSLKNNGSGLFVIDITWMNVD